MTAKHIGTKMKIINYVTMNQAVYSLPCNQEGGEHQT
jgi:hypothetical protein